MKTKPNYTQIAKYINNECTEEERSEFEKWLGESTEYKELFNQIKEAWEAHSVNPALISTNKKEAWDEFSKNTIGKDKSKTIKLYPLIAKIAAALILLFGIVYLINTQLNTNEEIVVVSESYDSNINVKKIILPDNTIVWLNENTAIKYPEKFSNNERRVSLTGEAYFEVTKNPQKPFIIETENTQTKVLGTSFNLKAYKEDKAVQLIVNSGKVAFASESDINKQLILTKGLAANYIKKTNKVARLKNLDKNYLAWKSGKLFFLNESLSDICKTLEKHYKIQITIKQPELRKLKLSATYNKKSIIEIANLISETLEIQYEMDDEFLVFYEN